ncbi:MAG TPA: hypothetical protein VMK32_08575 [Burkholderiaceae bacterium]|nr:hypothetical protein [Burkholderiaceae bacterium]
MNRAFVCKLMTLARAAAPLAAMFMLTGAALISCEGTSSSSGGGGGGTDPGSRPNSAAMGRWTPNTTYDTCTQAFHDSYFVIGPDGKKYPTWHPPTATDPATGKTCSFGHEHGRDPRGSALWDSVRNHFAFDLNGNGTIDDAERDASGVPFGYASEQLRAYNSANGIANANRDEDHYGYKIAWENGVTRTRTVNGQVQAFDLSCDVLTLLHQETYSADSYASNLHEALYAADCSRGADAAVYGGKVIVTAMTTFGNPGEFTVFQGNDTYSTVRFGTAQPLISPAGGAERGRVIPTGSDNVYPAVLVPIGQTSDFIGGLTETWYSALSLRRLDGSELVFVDPSFAVTSPSRYFDVTQVNGLARTVNLCYIGISLSGEVIDDPDRAALIVRQARGPECSGIAPNGPFTLRVNRVGFDDPRSVFNGCRRTVTIGTTRIVNGGGGTLWYTDPYGAAARTASFVGGVRQYVGVINNSGAAAIDRIAFGAELDPCLSGSNIHAPN